MSTQNNLRRTISRLPLPTNRSGQDNLSITAQISPFNTKVLAKSPIITGNKAKVI
jgi:hypothetical protein